MQGVDWVSLLTHCGTLVATGVIDSFDKKFKQKYCEPSEGEQFRNLRVANGYTQKDVANELNFAITTIWDFEHDLPISANKREKLLTWKPEKFSLKKFMEIHKLKNKEVEQAIGVRYGTFQAWKTGKYKMPRKYIPILEEYVKNKGKDDAKI